MGVVGRDLWSTCSAAWSGRTRSDNVEIGVFVDEPRESSGRFRSGEVAGEEDGVRTAKPRKGSKKTTESVCVVIRTSGKRKKEVLNA